MPICNGTAIHGIETGAMTVQPASRVNVAFCARDGYSLQGSYFPTATGAGSPVLICPATGLRQSFYFAFADWLRHDGHPTFVFDYRGIGASRGSKTGCDGCHEPKATSISSARKNAMVVQSVM